MYQIDPNNPLPNQLNSFADDMRLVAERKYSSLLAQGAPGIGKSYTAKAVLSSYPGLVWQLYPSASYAAFVQKLYELRHGGVLLFDEADGMLRTKSDMFLNLLKNVMDPDTHRHFIVYDTMRAREDDDVAPPQFYTEVQVVILTNLDLSDKKSFGTMYPHIEALWSRMSSKRRFSIDPNYLLDYVLWLILEKDILKDRNFGGAGRTQYLSLAAKNDILRFACVNAARLDEISVRKFVNLARLRFNKPDDWQKTATDELLPVARVMRPVPVAQFNITPKPQIANARKAARHAEWLARARAASAAAAKSTQAAEDAARRAAVSDTAATGLDLS